MADSTTTAVSPLRRRMIDDMMLRNLSTATQRPTSCSWPCAQGSIRVSFSQADNVGGRGGQAFDDDLVAREKLITC